MKKTNGYHSPDNQNHADKQSKKFKRWIHTTRRDESIFNIINA